jgi:hypothetical protein
MIVSAILPQEFERERAYDGILIVNIWYLEPLNALGESMPSHSHSTGVW